MLKRCEESNALDISIIINAVVKSIFLRMSSKTEETAKEQLYPLLKLVKPIIISIIIIMEELYC